MSNNPKAGVAAVIAAVVVLIGGIGIITSVKSVAPSDICVVQEGGPFHGRNVKEVRQSGSGPKYIGWWSSQFCYPATQRNYIVSSDPSQGDQKGVDFVEVQTKDAQTVRVNGQALMQLNTDPAVMALFHKKYGLRTFNGGDHPYDGDSGWKSFLEVQFRPVLDNALREAIGSFNCTELNAACQYVTQAEQAVKGQVQAVDTSQNLAQVQKEIETRLTSDINSTLGGQFFTNLRWRFSGSGHGGGAIAFTPKIQAEIEDAQAKQTRVASAKLDGQARVQQAQADTTVAQQQAEQIRLKAQSYKDNPAQAAIDYAHAVCGKGGCQNLQVWGGNGNVTKLIGK